MGRFATVHFPDLQTDKWARQQVRNMSTPLAMLIESDAVTTTTVLQPFVRHYLGKLVPEKDIHPGHSHLS